MPFDDLRARVERWIADDPDPAAADELRALLAAGPSAQGELADRFAGDLAFGTAGLRGVLGAGSNRMNRAVVVRTTWALAHELLASVARGAARGVVVGADARRMSRELAEDTAAVLAGAGLRVVLFESPVPTPLVGFAVKRLGAAAGVVITASHNPPEYNGYKVYWGDAAQIVPPVDAHIAARIARAPSARAVVRPSLAEASSRGLLTYAGSDLEQAYLSAVSSLARTTEQDCDRALRIVYTPLHGVGDSLARRALAGAGFGSVSSVLEQQQPDGAFPTVTFPNPEEPGTLALALALARRTSADLVLANDPDADRLAVAVPDTDQDGGYRQLTGNEIGVLLGAYLLERPRSGGSGKRRAALASIVSSPMLGRIASSVGAHYEETLTGFKWIGQRAIELEGEGYDFVFGYEEALGYAVGDLVYDKDGISAAVVFAELAGTLRARGSSVLGALEEIASRFGAFASVQRSVTRKGSAGAAEIRAIMDGLRAKPPARVGDDEVVAVADYDTGRRLDLRTGVRTSLGLPQSNVLVLELVSGGRICARPSGTEPKAKFYFDVCGPGPAREPGRAALARARTDVNELARAFLAIAVPG